MLVSPGTFVVDSGFTGPGPTLEGTILGAVTSLGSEIDPSRGLAYRAMNDKLHLLSVATYLQIGEITLGDSTSNAHTSNNRIGRMDLSTTGPCS